jgi:uncharacterized DUF497 family protein
LGSEQNAENVRKHGISFEQAVRIFEGCVFEIVDDREDYGEARWISIGETQAQEITVISTERDGGTRRIISGRPATKTERERYWKERARA